MHGSFRRMPGFIVLAFTGALLQQASPHPSTLTQYAAPAIRPFEPTSDFGRDRPQGDAGPEAHRRPLDAPVSVEAYVRSYEYSPGDTEAAYDQGVAAAEIRVDQSAGVMDGPWRVSDEQGRVLFGLVLDDDGQGPVEGGWRGAEGAGPATVDGRTVTLGGLGSLSLEPAGRGWRGVLIEDERTRIVTVRRVD